MRPSLPALLPHCPHTLSALYEWSSTYGPLFSLNVKPTLSCYFGCQELVVSKMPFSPVACNMSTIFQDRGITSTRRMVATPFPNRLCSTPTDRCRRQSHTCSANAQTTPLTTQRRQLRASHSGSRGRVIYYSHLTVTMLVLQQLYLASGQQPERFNV